MNAMEHLKTPTFTAVLALFTLICLLSGTTGGFSGSAVSMHVPPGWPRLILILMGAVSFAIAVLLEVAKFRQSGKLQLASSSVALDSVQSDGIRRCAEPRGDDQELAESCSASPTGGPALPEFHQGRHNEGTQLHLQRRHVHWPKYGDGVQHRFWACGTSLVAVSEGDQLQKYCKRGVNARIILPNASSEFASYEQLAGYDASSAAPTLNQVELAQRCYERFCSLDELPRERRIEDIVKRYGGIMYANITILDDDAFIAFYDTTGLGDYSFTLQCSRRQDPESFDRIEAEFLRMWNAPPDFGRKPKSARPRAQRAGGNGYTYKSQ